MGLYTEEFDGYFLWLCDLVNADMSRYSELLYALHEMDFVWVIDLDSDRADDGLELRRKYYQTNPDDDWVMFWDRGCTVFEALIGIARRMNYILEDEDSGDMSFMYFWEFIRNLGLKKYSNNRLRGLSQEQIDTDFFDIQLICSNWMNRKFEPNGQGSIFPLPSATENQAHISLTYQMNNYVIVQYLRT